MSGAVSAPQVFPWREQKIGSGSGWQVQVLVPEQVAGRVQVPQLGTVRAWPQVSVAVSGPQVFPRRAQSTESFSGTQVQRPASQPLPPSRHEPHCAVRGWPQSSRPVTSPHSAPRRAQKSLTDSVQPPSPAVPPPVEVPPAVPPPLAPPPVPSLQNPPSQR